MKWVITALLLAIAYLQFRLWIGEGSIAEVVQLERKIDRQHAEIQSLKERNEMLAVEVKELKSGLKSLEARARSEMGMIKEGETFFIVVDEEDMPDKSDKHSQSKP